MKTKMRSARQRLHTICSHVKWSKEHGRVNLVQTRSKVLSTDNINPFVKNMEYAVRGPIVIRAAEIEQELKAVSFFGVNICKILVSDSTFKFSFKAATVF